MHSRLPLVLLVALIAYASLFGAPVQPENKPPKDVPMVKLHFGWVDISDGNQFGTSRAFIVNYDEVRRVAIFYPDVREINGTKIYGPGHCIAKVWVNRADALPVVQENGRPALAWGVLKVKFFASHYESIGRCGALGWAYPLPESKLITGGQ
jgi:hypothetical protein